MKKICNLFFCFLFVNGITFGQGSLYLSPSPELTALGGTGTAVLTDDPYSFYYNPAQLGQWSRENNFGTHFYTNHADLYPGYSLGLELNNTAAVAGYNFRNILPKLDISVGVGYLYDHYDKFYREPGPTDALVNKPSYDYYKSYALGIGFHSYVDLSIGLAYKNLYQDHASNLWYQNYRSDRISGIIDYGALLNIPIHRLIAGTEEFSIQEQFFPFFNTTIGCALSDNKKQTVLPESIFEEYPLGRVARLGYSIDLGTDFLYLGQRFRLIEIKWITEALTFLDNSVNSVGDVRYQGGFGDIDIGSNLIQRKGSTSVSRLSGFSVEFARILTINSGTDASTTVISSSGYSIRLQGVLEALNAFYPRPFIRYLSQHFDVKYDKGTFFKGVQYAETSFEGIQFIVKGYSFDHCSGIK